MKETYGFRSNKSPPVVNELVAFESDIYQLIASIKFRHAPSTFLDCLDSDATRIKSSTCPLRPEGTDATFETSQAFVLLKDHKPNFATNLPCRLINPSKSDVGRVSKKILEKLTAQLRTSSSVNQWRSTGEVISWFKTNCTPGHVQFLQFDIESFYPSIS